MRILLVEDELNAARMLAKGLREQTYAVDIAVNGEDAIYQAQVNDYDLIILDIMLPQKDGFAVCEQLRVDGYNIPILMLTARDAVQDRIRGLDAGADDYLIKPFDFHELLARTRALLRRTLTLCPETITIADLLIDTQAHSVARAGYAITLTAKEYALLEYFARHVNKVITRSEIAEHVWDENFDAFSNLIEVYVKRLRRKIDDGHTLKLLRTKRGEGYILTDGAIDTNV